jgi:subtilase family serine protease
VRSFARTIAAWSGMLAILAACHGGSSNIPKYLLNKPAPVAAGATTTDFTWGQPELQKMQSEGASYQGPIAGRNYAISMNVALQLANEPGLLAYAREASDPTSPLYRHFLTPQQIGAMFGAPASNMASTAKYFRSYGISVGTWPQHLMLSLAGSTLAFQKAFNTTFAWYRFGKQQFLAPVPGSTPHLNSPLPISAVFGMVGARIAYQYIIRASLGQSTGYPPQLIADGFDFSGAWSAGYTGSGITTGIVGTGPILTDVSGKLIDDDIKQFASMEHASVATVVQKPVVAVTPSATYPCGSGETPPCGGTQIFDANPGGLATPPPATDPNSAACQSQGSVPNYNTCNPEDGEAQLDTEQIASLAPGSTVDFYLAYNPSECLNPSGYFEPPVDGQCPSGDTVYPLIGIGLADDEIRQAIADDQVDTLSLSYGEGEVDWASSGYFNSSGVGPGPDEFAALAAEGIAVFVSSGDTGNFDCYDPSTGAPEAIPCVSYPASDPSVVAVGGVNAPMEFDQPGFLTGQITAWADQTTGGGSGYFQNDVGSGGGVSQYFKAPSWQSAVTPASPNPTLGGMRGVPDIALMADPATGPSLLVNAAFPDATGYGPSGGTSAAAPESSAEWALVLQACKQTASCAKASGAHPWRLGNPNALYYQIATSSLNGMTYGQVFYDVLYGENEANGPAGSGGTPGPPITGCCWSGTGYDLVTGWGVPLAGHLVEAVTGQSAN